MKYQSYVFFFACSLLFFAANGQEAGRRWTVGAEVGLSVLHEEPLQSALSNTATWNSTQLANLTADFRLFRWLALRGETNFVLSNIRRSGRFFDNLQNGAYLLQWSTTTPIVGLTAGPQFLLRVGQGDVALDFLAGAIYQRSRAKGTTAIGETFDFKFRGDFNPFMKLGLSYTYWPVERFGINFGSEIGFFPFTSEQSRQASDLNELEQQLPDVPLYVIQNLSSSFDGTGTVHLTLGIAYRL